MTTSDVRAEYEAHDFQLEETGGGCTAFVRRDATGDGCTMVTAEDTPTAPETMDESILVCHCDADGTCYRTEVFSGSLIYLDPGGAP